MQHAKRKNNALDRIGEPLRVLQDGKRVPTGSGAPLSRYGGSVKDQMTLLSAKEGALRGINVAAQSEGASGDWPVIPTPCLGAGRALWAYYALGWDSLGEGVPRLRSLGLPPVKTQYIIQSLSQKKFIAWTARKMQKSLSGKRVESTRTVSVLFCFLIDRACLVVDPVPNCSSSCGMMWF